MRERGGFYIGLMLEEAAANNPAAPVTVDTPLQLAPHEGTTLSVARLDRVVRETAGRLLAAGATPGRHIAVFKTNTFDICLLAMAVQRIGAVPVLISPALDGPAARRLIAKLDEPWLLTDRVTLEASGMDGVPARVILIDGDAVPGTTSLGGYRVESLAGTSVPEPDQPAFISHTSGTTGPPKLAVQTPSVLWERLRVQKASADELWDDQPVALCVSLVHARFYTALYLALSRGNPLLVAVDDSPANIGALFARHRPGIVETTPNSFVDWEVLAGADGEPLANVRFYYATFDAMHPRTIHTLLAASKREQPRFMQLYGQTELGPVATRWFDAGDVVNMDARCVGYPLPGVTNIRVVDDGGAELGAGVPGHIEVSSRTRATTYLGEESRFAEQLRGEWWQMGDIGFLDEDGRLHLLDRAIDQVECVDSNLEIEDLLMQRMPELREIVLLPGGGKPLPVVCTRDDAPLDARRWQHAVADLPTMANAVQLPFDQVPRTATQKVRRPELIEQLAQGSRCD